MDAIKTKIADVLYNNGYLDSFGIAADGTISMSTSAKKIEPHELRRIKCTVVDKKARQAKKKSVLLDIDIMVPYELYVETLAVIVQSLPEAIPSVPDSESQKVAANPVSGERTGEGE